MSLIRNLLLLYSSSGAALPSNTIAPAISTTSIIGTQLTGDDGTWTGAPTFTYKWQRNGVDIGGATSKNYTPVDADFGYALRLVVTPNTGIAANSNSTNLTREAPVQTFGSERLTNGNFSSWTTDNPNSWTVTGESGSDPMVTQVDPSGSAGTGAARIVSTSVNITIRQDVLTSNNYYETRLDETAYTSGTLVIKYSSSLLTTFTGVKSVAALDRAPNIDFYVGKSSGSIDAVIDNVSVKLVTLNGQLVAPSADMRITQLYTLPASPSIGDSIWVLPRISDFTNGNYWLAFLTYTGTQWNITLYSVAAFVRTSRATATNIGSTNGLRINMNGTSILLETTADGGSNWTQRGITVTNSTYQAATGVNSLATSPFTLGNLVYEAAV